MRPVPLVLAVAAALGSAPGLAAPPTVPADLRVDVYSGTAAELFWSRSSDPDGLVRGYEITKGGALVTTLDGLSYFTDSLVRGQASTFTVTAIDFDGERSAPVAVSVVGGDRSGAVGAGGGRPTPPANLRADVYSSSAIELFWDRNPAQRLSYEVLIDGQSVTTTDGTSYFTDGLRGGQRYEIDVVAIDSNGRRSGAANVTVNTTGGTDAPTNPMQPVTPAPANLRSELYSSTAGELFWDRVPGANLSYEVSLGGGVVATTDGTSYFVGGRRGLDGTRVRVVAIGPNGRRSSVSSTTFGDGAPSPDPGDAPPAPANARLDVYSSTAAELFFDRAPSSANVVETEISRDGEVIGSTNGTSFFDPGRTPGRDYVYELVAVNGSGARSSATTVGEATPPSQGDDLPTDAAARLDTLFALANGDVFERLLAFLDELGTRENDTERTPISSAFDPDFPQAAARTVYACPDGGTFALAPGSVSGVGSIFSTIAEGCTIGSATVDGTFVEQSFAGRGPNLSSFSTMIRGYRLSDADTGVTVTMDSGEVSESEPAARDGSPFVTTGWIARELSVVGSAMDYSATNQVTIFSGVDSLDPTETIGLTVTIEGLEYASSDGAAVETVTAFRRADADENFTVGSLTIADGSRVETLDADSGDPDTFLLTVQDGGATTSYVVPWSDRFDFERIDLDAVQFGQ